MRAAGRVEFPARFQLLAAMNPCPCGKLTVPGGGCVCSARDVQKYLKKLSQPILDRIDLHVELDPVPLSVLVNPAPKGNDAESFKRSVGRARDVQWARQGKLNGDLSGDEVRGLVRLDHLSQKLLEKAGDKIGLSARGFMRVVDGGRRMELSWRPQGGHNSVYFCEHIGLAQQIRCNNKSVNVV